MNRSIAAFVVASATAFLVVLGCGSDRDGPAGTCGFSAPGVVVQQPGIVFSVRNRQGNPIGRETNVSSVNGGQLAGYALRDDSLNLDVFLQAGTYAVSLSSPFYRDTTIRNLSVVAGDCGSIQTAKRAVILELAPNAPPVRSVAVFGTSFLATPGSTTHMIAIVDADTTVSRAVTWRLSDTTMARVDATGLVTAKCSVHGGVDTATAISVADPKVSDRAPFGVGASGSC